MPQTLKQLQSRKRKLERELREVEKDIAGIRSLSAYERLSKKLENATVARFEPEMWSESLNKRFAGGFFRIQHAGGAYSLYAKTKTGILWHHTYARGKYNWVRVEGQ